MDKVTKAFLNRIDAAVAQHALLDHPFYQLWNKGELPREALDEYSRQYYAHVRAFPTYVSAVHSRCDDISVRQMLLDNLVEEEQGPDNHPELWLRFAEGLGVSRESAQDVEMLDATRESVATLRQLCEGDDYRNGVAALYAYESQVPDVSRTKREGLAKFYALDDPRAVEFFTVHEEADLRHRAEERAILARECRDAASRDAAVAAAGAASQALWHFLDGVYDAYIEPCAKCAA